MNQNTVAALIVRTKSGRDSRGNDTFTESAQVFPGVYWPDSSVEVTDGRDQVTWQSSLCLPAGAPVTAIDAVVPQVLVDDEGTPVLDGGGNVQGQRMEVDGQPSFWTPNPFTGWVPDYPVVLKLKQVSG